jgi:hypothetical protein
MQAMSKNLHKLAPASEEAFLDEKQILARLPISRRTLGNWKSRGFPYIKIGRRCLYSWGNCQQFLLRQQRGGIE